MVTNVKGDQVLQKLNGEKKPATLEDWLKKMKPQLARALPKHVNPDRILRIAMTTIRTSPKLRSCEPMSFLAALMQSAQLGLEPNTPLGEAYLIPYDTKDGMKAQFQIGYRGIIALAQNTGQYRSIYAHERYENDDFNYQLGLHKDLKHIPNDEPKGEPTHYYAVYHLLNGGYDFVVWSRKKVEQHRDHYSKSAKFQDSAWQTDFNAMAKKTLLIALLKYAPKSIELAKQLAMDETVKKDIAPDMSEVPAEEIDITPPKEEVNKQTGEVKESEPKTNEEADQRITNAVKESKKANKAKKGKSGAETEQEFFSDADLGIT